MDYTVLDSITFSAGDTVGSVQRVQLNVIDDRQVERDEIVQVMIDSETNTLHPVTTSSNRGVVNITVIDNDGEYNILV